LASQDEDNVSRKRYEIPRVHGVAVALLAAVLLLFWVFQRSDENQSGSGSATVSIPLDLSNSQLHRNDTTATAESMVEGSSNSASDIANKVTVTTDTVAVASASGGIDRSSPAVLGRAASTKAALVALPKAVVEKESVKSQSELDPNVAADAVMSQKPQKSAVVDKPANQPAKVAQQLISVPVSSGMSPREQRILNLPVTAYMLQLMGALDESRTRGVVKQYIGRLPLTYVETRRKDKPWFVAVAGPYDTRAAALAAIKELPPQLQKERPWPRSIATLQQEIRDSRR
jgi:DamX protein